ncbi:DUF3152 domain-containing protein [Nonomuraea purpurea]|uniref:DUF3152 domain-containing protein n=1 Tax=Nonomuraea purpurea TaxID=1849276 RepID=A0ABV8G2E6_9ACTN
MPLFGPLLLLLMLVAGCGSATPAPPLAPAPLASAPLNQAEPTPPMMPRRRPAQEVRVPFEASGRYAVVRGEAPPRPGRGAVVRYLVEVERGLPFDPDAFAAEVHRTLNDVRGWARFQRVDQGPVHVRVALSSPGLTISQCLPLRTGGELSCWNGTRSVINALRWAKGVPQYEGDLAAYRQYVISHEVGHSLGHDHLPCPGAGRLAPVMTQQSKSLGRCRPNPWPFPTRRGEEREEETEDQRP